ncbi:MAG TPA: alcohol dehydrogenase catalytic domain-containing protein [Gemmatimonadales bacterium]|nr:alcohol dehydrogenase catalytic domain-containing protein [Gemmatimonadales bacterium]
MRALGIERTGGPDEVRVLDVPTPVPTAADDVRIRVRAAALNHLDLFVVQGLKGLRYSFPHVVGSDGAGVVEAVGPAVEGWRPGDEVLVNPGVSCGECEWCRAGDDPLCPGYGILGEHRPGAAGEYLVVPARNLARKPAELGWAEAAAYPLATLTAWRMLVTRARVAAGETVLVRGIGGGVAQAAARIARHLGARVIATSTSEAKLRRVRELLDVETVDPGADLPQEVKRLTGGRGADVVVDSVGEATWPASLRSLGRGGRLVTCGGTSGPMVTTDVRKLFWYQWSLLGSTMGSAAEFAAIARLAAEPALRPVVDAVIPLADGAAAFRRLASGAQFGKLVLEVSS